VRTIRLQEWKDPEGICELRADCVLGLSAPYAIAGVMAFDILVADYFRNFTVIETAENRAAVLQAMRNAREGC
jgi:hypothetical protein